tara:strand:+ start:190 stop:564 length:375 start_codon:yes stop_codon:yes gene_type:complete
MELFEEEYADKKKTNEHLVERTNQTLVKNKFKLVNIFKGENIIDVNTNNSHDIIISNSDYQVINGVYIKKGIINEKPYWFKKATQTYDEEIGYHIYLADSTINRWVISNGRNVIYECISNTIEE